MTPPATSPYPPINQREETHPEWTVTGATVARLLDNLNASTAVVATETAALADMTEPDGFAAAFEWAMRQDFDPDHAERIRREAWGRQDT
ncbi:MAG TPA: hypothetical protein VHF89_19700 [Solirubrobacteraceae bacterium]|nr:hypothetical protein [Solirubrobacteraceae bacterium]